MNRLKWFFMSKYKKFLYAVEVQYHNRGGLWVYTDKYSIRFDFGDMNIEVHNKGMCENFINLGYTKISEGSVVVDKEKYDRLIEKINRGWLPEPSDWEFRIKLAKDQARKQAVKEVLEKLHNSLDKSIPAINGVLVMLIKNMIDEIAKEMGVEL